jgi:membrane-bound lytic murein transglycosylase MltF
VPYSRTLYYKDKARERGVSADNVRDFERYINRKYAKELGKRPITVYAIPTTRDALLAAQGYQESMLDQSARSHAGAIGVMQVMPATGAQLKVSEITITEPNIHADARYMDHLMTRYFPDAKFDAMNRSLVAFADYNAGLGRIARLRQEAQPRALDPDVWFNNVEIVVAEKIGIETTTYVRNICKYYTAYKLMLDVEEAQRKAREQVAPDRSPSP